MNVISLVIIGLIAAILSIILRQHRPEFSIYISLMAGIIITIAVLGALMPVLVVITELTEMVNLNSLYVEILLKALAVCYISQIAIDTCKDAGESAIAGKIEMAGKIAIVVISLPLFKNLVDIVIGLIK